MILDGHHVAERLESIPRESGDDPVTASEFSMFVEYSPRERG